MQRFHVKGVDNFGITTDMDKLIYRRSALITITYQNEEIAF